MMGVSGIIYANQGIRGTVKMLHNVFKHILENGSSVGIESEIATMQEIFELQGMKKYYEDEERYRG